MHSKLLIRIQIPSTHLFREETQPRRAQTSFFLSRFANIALQLLNYQHLYEFSTGGAFKRPSSDICLIYPALRLIVMLPELACLVTYILRREYMRRSSLVDCMHPNHAALNV